MELEDRLFRLKDKCIRCWADEIGDFFPIGFNKEAANKEMKKLGNPDCVCKGEAKREFKLFNEPTHKNHGRV